MGRTFGVAYEIEGEAALQYLNSREVELGGYTTEITCFQAREGCTFPVLLYIATPDSKDWSGPAPPQVIAAEILSCSGATGHNVEYLLRLAEFMRDYIPEGYDDHLITLEMLVRSAIKEKKLCLKTLMGNPPPPGQSQHRSDDDIDMVGPMPAAIVQERRDTFQYSAKVPAKKLRCLNL
ncbi:hypothetical protein HAZT_HAZT001098 [Hyalella azteca]|uniref:Uncharacterized protein n=1 Tax=Hyalella azteca TaxID=294128 RepID=A0A6A0GR13_HYAAZ|nr:hypothetical protein HAZT_HAZT001098 [Hyalella azteca]